MSDLKTILLILCILSFNLNASENTEVANHIFDCGLECEQQYSQLRKYARNGSPRAQTLLAISYKTGEYGSVNHNKAWKWIRRAKRQRHAPALFIGSQWYRQGFGTDIDIDEANDLLKRSATMNFPPAILDLAKLMFNSKQYEKSYSLLDKASSFGLAEAKIIIDKIKPKLTIAKLEKAKSDHVSQNSEMNDATRNHTEGEVLTIFADEQDPITLMGNMLTDIKSDNFYEHRGTTGSRLSDRKCGQAGSGCSVITRETLERSGF